MASAQSKAEKDRFFAHLDHLGESDDDDDDDDDDDYDNDENEGHEPTSDVGEARAPIRDNVLAPPRPQSKGRPESKQTLETKTHPESKDKKMSSVPAHSTLKLAIDPEDVIELDSSGGSGSGIPKSSIVGHDKIRKGNGDRISGSSKARSEAVIELKPSEARSTTMKPSKRRKTKSKDEILLVPEEDRIFRNMTFFFVPNSDVAPARKKRIRSAIAHGALWARRFDRDVTHVIVDVDLDFAAAAKGLPSGQRYRDVVLLKDTWLSESVEQKAVQNIEAVRFRVKGAPVRQDPLESKKTDTKPEVLVGKPVVESARSLKRKLDNVSTPETESVQDLARADDELDRIVAEVRNDESTITDHEHSSFRSLGSAVSETPPPENIEVHDMTQKDQIKDKQYQGFQCMEKNDGRDGMKNPNARTIEMLQKMATFYDRTGDSWRTLAYRKAIGALRKQETLISTRDEALAIPQIGDRLADKIEEIVTTDRLRRYEAAIEDPNDKVLQLFMGIYDVGLKQATLWIGEGHRTLEDLTRNVRLTPNQKIGIEHYNDFMQRIPRAEVAQHGAIVLEALRQIDGGFEAIVGGSYRRGQPNSGDIDVIITQANEVNLDKIRVSVMDLLIPHLQSTGFIKATLASSMTRDRGGEGGGSKWHGASCLPDSTTWRRIDFLLVPYHELGAALIYFTGNDIFNRSLRLLASKKGMRLNQHGLYRDHTPGSVRAKEKGKSNTRRKLAPLSNGQEGELIESASETKIFQALGVPWRPPSHRIC